MLFMLHIYFIFIYLVCDILLIYTASDILTSPVHKWMWQVHPNKPNIHLVDPAVFRKFKNKLEEVKAGVVRLKLAFCMTCAVRVLVLA